ncbi:MAG: hypothetical protein JJ959_01210 [Nisaea sp.]|uniref:hypothetical protein n=1 Tax=Nisaea sp. TaxID=2024842 RepID=UPI001B224A7E|nr:hypothetical protein [Nisaea sp.]MBO6559117.1 hypothetical protein [Nisaea sp.]
MIAEFTLRRCGPFRIAAAILLLFPVFGADAVRAGEADVENVRVERAPGGTYTFHVTVCHADTGWDHYANAWTVHAPDGTLLGERVLYHPHVDEQPFTRSLSGVSIPAGVTRVIVRARDSQHGKGGRDFEVELP